MTEMSNKEVLDFNRPEETKDFPVQIDGTSALKLDDIPEEQNRGKEIEEVRDEINATQGLTVVEPVNEEVIFEPIKDIDIKPSLAKRAAKFIKKTWLKIGTMFLASATLSSAAACGPIEAAESTPEPTTITATQPAEVHVGDATMHTSNETIPEETPSPSPETTETPIFSEERTIELNQKISDFNNNQGDFTKEKKSEMAIGPETTEDLDLVELGVVTGEPSIEGHFFDYFEKDGSLILLMGFDGKDGKSFTTPVEIPLYFLAGESKSRFNFNGYEKNTVFSSMTVVESIAGGGNVQDLFSFLDKLKNKVIIIKPSFELFPGSVDDHTGVTADYFVKHDSKVGLAGKLISEVATNGVKIDSGYNEADYKNYDLIKLDSISDANNIELSKVPMIHLRIGFFVN